jgi:hypothetical protein
MKRLIATLLVLLVPLGVSAQGPSRAAGAPRLTTDRERPSAAPAPDSAQPPAARPAAQPRRRKRRGSMVGYIADALVESKLRLRFDAGSGVDAPDRAEFFYAKCGCYRLNVPQGDPAYDPDAPGPGPGIVTDLNFQQLYVQGEYAPTERFSVFAELPFRRIDPKAFAPAPPGSFGSQSGIGDVQVGVKLALQSTPTSTVTLQLQGYLPTGTASKGLGTDHASVEPALLAYHELSDRAALEWQIGDRHPLGGSAGVPTTSSDKFAGDVLFYGIGPSYEVYRSGDTRLVPVVELVGWRVLNGFETGKPSRIDGTNIVNLKLGARVVWGEGERSSLYVGYGHALTTAHWYDDVVRLEYRLSFGRTGEGAPVPEAGAPSGRPSVPPTPAPQPRRRPRPDA